MQDLKDYFQNVVHRLEALKHIPENQFVHPPELSSELQAKLQEDWEKALRVHASLRQVPEWAASLGQYLVDWHDILATSGAEEFANLLHEADWTKLYLTQEAFQKQQQTLVFDSLFQSRLKLIAAIVDAAAQHGIYPLRIRPEWFLCLKDKVDCAFASLEEGSIKNTGAFLQYYEPCWMHPALRMREIPSGFDLHSGVTYSYVYFIFYTLFLPPQVKTPHDFGLLVEFYRALNPFVPAELRDFFRSYLLPGEQSLGTAKQAWTAFTECVAQAQTRQATGYVPGYLEYKAESVYGRHKRNNENEDAVLQLSGLPDHQALIGIADGVTTADIGSGYVASTSIKMHLERHADWYRNQIQNLPDPAQDLQAWKQRGQNLLQNMFSAVHQEVVEEANRHLSQDINSSQLSQSMTSTLIMALVWGNQVLIAHWGDSRAYALLHGRLVRLTEDHNLLFDSIRSSRNGEVPFQSPGKGSQLTRCVGAGKYHAEQAGVQAIPAESMKVSFDHCVLNSAELLVLCSDGLLPGEAGQAEVVNEKRIQECITQGQDESCRDLAWHLAREVDESDGQDNISVLVLRFYGLDNKAQKKEKGKSQE